MARYKGRRIIVIKKIILPILCIFSFHSFADIDLEKLSGSWSMNCTQTQKDNGFQAYLIEVYTFKQSGNYRLTQQWYKDANCKDLIKNETQIGTISISKENTNNGFNPAGTYETKYAHTNIVELGLLWVDKKYSKLRVGKGFGKSQNTLLGIFEYNKT